MPEPTSINIIDKYHSLFEYDSVTGNLIRRVPRGRHNAGSLAGSNTAKGYRKVNLSGQSYLIHRIVWEMHNGPIPKGLQIDHINGMRDDNRLANLRLATPAQNQRNRKLQKLKSLPKGVTYSGQVSNPYTAKITVNGNRIHLGAFACPCEAQSAYMESALKHFGKYARAE